MAQLSDDCFAHGGALQRLDEALALLEQRLTCVVATETLPLALCLDRILAADIVANVSVPPADNSAVDGYAVRFADLRPDAETVLPVAGRVAAGHPAAMQLAPGTAMRIFTGAVIPAGADTVMMQEDCIAEGNLVRIQPGIRPGANRRLAGEDIARGRIALHAGCRLGPAEIALAAASGHARLTVRLPLRVALISTGDEVNEAGAPLPAGGIYDANRPMLAALLRRIGCEVTDLGIQPDKREQLAKALREAAAGHDAVIGSGGVSIGEEDHVRAAIEQQGSLHLWRLAIKPGRPVALGQINGAPYFGLPGNPVAALLTFCFFAKPLLARLGGRTLPPPLSFPVTAGFTYRKKADRREWVRVILRGEPANRVAEKFPVDGAGVITSLTGSDGVITLDESCERLEKGQSAAFTPFSSLMG